MGKHMTHTKDRLAAALRDVGLNEMADRAAGGYYDDFLSPLDLPLTVLAFDLAGAAVHEKDNDRAGQILELRERAMSGEFDATDEESEAWAASPEGQFAMRRLLGRN